MVLQLVILAYNKLPQNKLKKTDIQVTQLKHELNNKHILYMYINLFLNPFHLSI